jgi:peroxiredoxin
MRALAAVLALLAAIAARAGEAPAWTPREGGALLGEPAPAWQGLEWLQQGPLTLEDLRGKVVLVRFWAVDCPYCEVSLPALAALHEKHREQGLVVVGIHHPKSEEGRDPRRVRAAVRRLALPFPIAIDDGWKTVRAYGVGSHFLGATSISVLIDRQGVIRFVHDGGDLHPGEGEGHE